MNQPNRENGEEAVIELIIRRILEGDFELPPIPEVMLKIHRSLENENGSVKDVVRIVMADQVLTTKILKVVNSAFYSLARPITSVQHAIVCIGFKAVQGIVTAQTLSSIFVRNREEVKRVLQHGFKCACLARKIAGDVGVGQEEAFVSALLHNIGKTVLLNLCSDYELSREAGVLLADTHHQQVGVLLAAKWNLPEVVIETIECHHAPAQASQHGKVVECVHLANGLLAHPDRLIALRSACIRIDFSKVDTAALKTLLPKIEKMAGDLL